jgi:hypothetical protein
MLNTEISFLGSIAMANSLLSCPINTKLSFSNYSFAEEFTNGTWVKLQEKPSEYSYDQAVLLCPESSEHWLAWIPDYGQALLHVSQFVSLD